MAPKVPVASGLRLRGAHISSRCFELATSVHSLLMKYACSSNCKRCNARLHPGARNLPRAFEETGKWSLTVFLPVHRGRSAQKKPPPLSLIDYDTIRIMVDRIKSKISSTAASGNRDKDGMSATASSTSVSVATKFMSAATSAPCNSNSSPSSVSLRKVERAL